MHVDVTSVVVLLNSLYLLEQQERLKGIATKVGSYKNARKELADAFKFFDVGWDNRIRGILTRWEKRSNGTAKTEKTKWQKEAWKQVIEMVKEHLVYHDIPAHQGLQILYDSNGYGLFDHEKRDWVLRSRECIEQLKNQENGRGTEPIG